VLFLALALVPYLSIHYALAPRYVYMASVPFSMLAGLFFSEIARYLRRFVGAAPIALAALALAILGLYAWQTIEQNQELEARSAKWESVIADLERSGDVPGGSRAYLRGGPQFDPPDLFGVLPAVGELRWGNVELFAVPEGTKEFCARAGAPTYVLDYAGDRYVQAAVIDATEGDEPYRWPPPIPPPCTRNVTLP
jgi:hypothetical protein